MLMAGGPVLAPLTTVKKRKGFVDTASLAANWKIGLELACLTVSGTTQPVAANLVKIYSFNNSKWKLIKGFIADKSKAPIYCDNEEITPE
jgi:hypothetical protein